MLYHQFKKRLGKPILFLHGLGEDHSIFNRQINYVDSYKRSTLAVDLEGHGRSTLKNGRTSIPQQAEGLEEVLQLNGIEKTDIVGFSLGGAVALEYAAAYPEKVEKLCLINPALYHNQFLSLQVKLVRNLLEMVKGVAQNDHLPREEPADLSKAPFSNAYFSFLNGLRATPAAGLYANIHALMDYGIPNWLSDVNTDTLIVRSNDDELLKEEASLFIEDRLANSKLVRIPGKHVVMLDQPEIINELLRDL